MKRADYIDFLDIIGRNLLPIVIQALEKNGLYPELEETAKSWAKVLPGADFNEVSLILCNAGDILAGSENSGLKSLSEKLRDASIVALHMHEMGQKP